MDKLDQAKGTLFIGLLLTASNVTSANTTVPVRINNFVIPAVFASALNQGMTVPVFIRYEEQPVTQRSKQKIADAIISIKDGAFQVNQITLAELSDSTELAKNLKAGLAEIKDQTLGDGNILHISKDASISLDTRSFYLEMTVNKEAMAAAILPRTNILGESSADNLSNILNYTVGSYYSKYSNTDNASSYITLDNTTALREHHFNVNGSVYGIGSTGGTTAKLYRSMYERDFQGRRLAMGMVDTWNLQSIASMSALNSSRIYGVSYGNKSSTQIDDNTLSLIPVTVFLPAAGEVRIYREGRLMSIQNFSMGSYEVDTSRLPFGVYNVDVEVVVNGKVVNSRTAQINKSFSRSSSVTGDVSWQFFGGMLQYSRMDYRDRKNINYGDKETWISGVAAAVSQPWLSGVNFKSTLYGFDRNAVNESEVNVAFNQLVTANQQTLLANDGSWQSISTLNLSVPNGYGSIWTSREFSSIGNRLPMQKGDYFSVGATANLSKLTPYLGSLTISRTDNKYNGNKYTNADYSQSLLANRYASISMRAGIQRYFYDNREGVSDKYINLDISLPLSTWFSAGVSSENGNMLANATLRKNFDDSAITQAGASLSKRLQSSDESSYRSDDFSASGYLSYDTKYNAGTLSATQTSDNSRNFSLSSQGSVAWTKDNIALGKGTQTSGVMVNTNFSEAGKMIAQINGRSYPLSGKNNYISLPPYAQYKVELMNDKTSADSVDIVSGRTNQVVLYPGNVSVINPEIKQLVTVFGRVKNPAGGIYAFTDIHNHIGKTKTDERGEFAMDVDKRYPVITLIDNKGGTCEADLDLREARGAVWVGDIQCQVLQQTASLKEEKQNNVY